MSFLNSANAQASFDVECYRLAVYFLEDSPRNATETERRDLAATIQQTIEDWLEDQDMAREARAYGDYIDRKIDERRIEGRP